MLREGFHPDRLKCPGPDVERHVGDVDAAPAQCSEQRLVEVQARGRSGDGARGARIHRLVAALVPGSRRARDIWRKRNAAMALEQLEDRSALGKTQAVELPSRTSTRASNESASRIALPARGGLLART